MSPSMDLTMTHPSIQKAFENELAKIEALWLKQKLLKLPKNKHKKKNVKRKF